MLTRALVGVHIPENFKDNSKQMHIGRSQIQGNLKEIQICSGKTKYHSKPLKNTLDPVPIIYAQTHAFVYTMYTSVALLLSTFNTLNIYLSKKKKNTQIHAPIERIPLTHAQKCSPKAHAISIILFIILAKYDTQQDTFFTYKTIRVTCMCCILKCVCVRL